MKHPVSELHTSWRFTAVDKLQVLARRAIVMQSVHLKTLRTAPPRNKPQR